MGDSHVPHDIEVRDAATGRLTGRLRGHEEPVLGVAFLTGGRRTVSASSDRTLRLWDLTNSRELKRIVDHAGAVLCVAVSPDGRRVLTGTGHRWVEGWRQADSYGVHLWDLDSGNVLSRFEVSAPVHTVAFSSDGRSAIAGGEDGLVHTWQLSL
jgi:WD40 repeat protein